jgi:hypothetical protein
MCEEAYMEMPTIAHVRKDAQTGGTYEVRAYRKLSDAEVLAAVRSYLASSKRAKRPKEGTRITILTLHGATDLI